MPPSPNTKPLKFVIIGEGPGRKEIIRREAFVGITGEILNEELAAAGLDRNAAWVTNAALCASDDDKENARAAECCAPRLLKELGKLDPKVPLLPLGKAAVRSVLGVNSILLARGFVWKARELDDSIASAEAALRKAEKLSHEAEHKSLEKRKKTDDKVTDAKLRVDILKGRNALGGRTVLPLLHPTFAFIRTETWAPIFRIDLDRAARWIRGELLEKDLIDKIDRVSKISELKRRKRVFLVTDDVAIIDKVSKLLGNELGVDIETKRIKPLTPLLTDTLTVQISDGVRGIVISPWDAKKHAPALTRFLRNKTAVFHNGYCFDTIALERDGVSFEDVTLEDTLTAHHSFASQFPQKLDQVVSTFTDCGPWKVRHGVRGAEEKGLAPVHGDESDLELYGGTDAFVTILAWRAMQKDLLKERAVYEHDKRRSMLYRELQLNGYRVDRRRRNLLSKLLLRRASGLKGRMRRIARRPNFSPGKLGDVRSVLFGTLKAPMLNPTPTGLAGTSNATLESLRTGGAGDSTKSTKVGRFCETLLNWRAALKTKNTYIDPVQVHRDGRAHYNFKPFGVFTGRPASRILSAPRWSRNLVERAREIYIADVGNELVYFDLAQAEGRFAANLSADANFIAACGDAKGDLHTKNALVLFPEQAEMLRRDPKGKLCPRHAEKGSANAACNCGKPFRDVTKNAGFAILYQAGVMKVFSYLRSQGFDVDLSSVEAMFTAMRDAYPDYNRYVQDNIRWAQENGYLRTAIKFRIMWIGFHPEPSLVANLPIQSGIADVMDTRLLDEILPRIRGTGAKLKGEKAFCDKEATEPTGAKMVLHHYDSATFDTPKRSVDKVRSVIEEVWKAPVKLEKSIVARAPLEFVLPAETKTGRRWSDF